MELFAKGKKHHTVRVDISSPKTAKCSRLGSVVRANPCVEITQTDDFVVEWDASQQPREIFIKLLFRVLAAGKCWVISTNNMKMKGSFVVYFDL